MQLVSMMMAVSLRWRERFLKKLITGSTGFAQQAIRQGGQFRVTAVRLPDHASVRQHTQNDSVRRAAQCLDSITGLKFRGYAEFFDDGNHALAVEHAGDV